MEAFLENVDSLGAPKAPHSIEITFGEWNI